MTYESHVDRIIREARERGEFDDLPGKGKPLPLHDAGDPDWWLKDLVRRERIDLRAALPPAAALRREAEGFPESLDDLRSEASVRALLDDYNRRVDVERRRPRHGPAFPHLARRVDVEAMVEAWRSRRRPST